MSFSAEYVFFEALFDLLPFAVYIVDLKNYQIVYANKKMQEQAGEKELAGKTCYKHIFKNDRPCQHCRIGELLKNGKSGQKEVIFELFSEADDSWYQMQEKLISWPEGKTVKYSIAVEINQLKKVQNELAEAHAELAIKNKELERLSKTDSLTGLYNRLKLDQIMDYELKRAYRYQRPFSIIMLDLDDFKDINDELGHLAGDKVLMELARLLKAHIREPDLICRWGGEEFIIVSPETDTSGVKELAEKLRQIVAGHKFECGRKISISLGTTAALPQDSQEEMFARADQALYLSKTQGKNRVSFIGKNTNKEKQ